MNSKLDEAMAAARELPDDVQQILAEELLADVAHYRQSSLTPAQQAIAQERLSKPLDLVEPEIIRTTSQDFKSST